MRITPFNCYLYCTEKRSGIQDKIFLKNVVMLRFLWYADREKERGRYAVKCVYDDDRLPDGFEEHVQFSAQMPYTVRIKHFRTEDIVPLHYAETLEGRRYFGMRE